jgi:hypothetical protein
MVILQDNNLQQEVNKMAGGSGQSMPTSFAQTQGGGDKGTGQTSQMETSMGTPIIYGKTYLPQSGLSSNPPLSSAVVDRVNQQLNTQSPGGGLGDTGGGLSASSPGVAAADGVGASGMGVGSIGVGIGTGGEATGDSGDGGTGAASSAGGGGGSGGK